MLKQETCQDPRFVSFTLQIWETQMRPLGGPLPIDTQNELSAWVLLGLCFQSVSIRTRY
jgi:hypothetical protein